MQLQCNKTSARANTPKVALRLARGFGAVAWIVSLCAGGALAAETLPVAMEIAGSGPAAIFESGLGESRAGWKAVGSALAQCLTVVTYDRPGLGESPPRPDPKAPVLAADVADNLFAALQSRNIQPPYILVAHSLGSLYMQAFARNHPQTVAAMVLIDGSSPLEPPGVFVTKARLEPGSTAAAEQAGIAPSVAALLAGPPLPPLPLVVIAATYHDMAPERERLWRDVQQRTAALSPKGQLWIADSGHFIQTDQPGTVVSAVLTAAHASGADIASCQPPRQP